MHPDEDDPWPGILSAIDFAEHTMYHTMLQSMPDQLLFGRYIILNTPFITDWGAIRIGKQQLIYKNNKNKINIANCNTIAYVREYCYAIKKQTNMRSHANTLI